MKKWTKKNIFWTTLLSILCIVCFPVNPLVLSGILETGYNQAGRSAPYSAVWRRLPALYAKGSRNESTSGGHTVGAKYKEEINSGLVRRPLCTIFKI